MNFLREIFKGGNADATAVKPEPDRKAELLAEIRSLDQELADHDHVSADFRSRHWSFVNGQLMFTIPHGADPAVTRGEIESRWRTLCQQRDAIQVARNNVLSKLARYSK